MWPGVALTLVGDWSKGTRPAWKELDMGIRVLGLLTMLGGVGVAIGAAFFVGANLSAPAARPWDVVRDPFESSIMAVAGNGGLVAIAVATAGLVLAFQDRISSGGALAGSIGAVGGIVGLMGAFAMLLALPVGSAILVWDLARARVLSRWLAAAHVASAAAFVIPIAAMLSNTPVGIAFVSVLFYPLTWLAIGGTVLRGAPAASSNAGSRL